MSRKERKKLFAGQEVFGPNDWILASTLRDCSVDQIDLLRRGLVARTVDVGSDTFFKLKCTLKVFMWQ